MSQWNRSRRQFTTEQKVALLRPHLVAKELVSKICAQRVAWLRVGGRARSSRTSPRERQCYQCYEYELSMEMLKCGDIAAEPSRDGRQGQGRVSPRRYGVPHSSPPAQPRKAKQYWKRLLPVRSRALKICLRNGITEAMLTRDE